VRCFKPGEGLSVAAADSWLAWSGDGTRIAFQALRYATENDAAGGRRNKRTPGSPPAPLPTGARPGVPIIEEYVVDLITESTAALKTSQSPQYATFSPTAPTLAYSTACMPRPMRLPLFGKGWTEEAVRRALRNAHAHAPAQAQACYYAVHAYDLGSQRDQVVRTGRQDGTDPQPVISFAPNGRELAVSQDGCVEILSVGSHGVGVQYGGHRVEEYP